MSQDQEMVGLQELTWKTVQKGYAREHQQTRMLRIGLGCAGLCTEATALDGDRT